MRQVCVWLGVVLTLLTAESGLHSSQPSPPAYALRAPVRFAGVPRHRHLLLTSRPQRALLDKYCVTCHNERARYCGLVLDKMDPARIPEGAGNLGKSGAEAPRRHDATAGHAAARRGDARGLRIVAGDLARSRRDGQPEPGPSVASSPQPHRIRERDPRPARSGDRRHVAAARRR